MTTDNKPTSEEIEKEAKQVETEAIELDDFDLSLPETATARQALAVQLHNHLLNAHLLTLSAAANRGAANDDQAKKNDIDALFARQMAARLQKAHSGLRGVMMEQLARDDARLETMNKQVKCPNCGFDLAAGRR